MTAALSAALIPVAPTLVLLFLATGQAASAAAAPAAVHPASPGAVSHRPALPSRVAALPAPAHPAATPPAPPADTYPESSLVDYSSLLRPPAGRFGFLRTGDDGHFHWSDGRRARFWGVVISRRSVRLPHAEIARVAGDLARAGCNLVRFEALDGPDGLLSGSPDDTRHLNTGFLDDLDFWIASLRARGIYYYLDLLDFRSFLPGDGVPNADRLGIAARPYAVFDPRLVSLQKEFAAQLLLTPNPYTHLRPVEDPALVMVELFNEHGLFMSITEIHKLLPPYNAELQALWNDWLVRHYTDRATLAAHWLTAATPLGKDEDPAAGTVCLVAMPPADSGWDHGGVHSVRVRDQVSFLADTQRQYFRAMRQYLHGIGLKCPITAAVTSTVGPDVLSVADELDCTAENYYADHPKYEGTRWQGRVYYDNDNQLRSSQPWESAPQIALLRWNNKPVVIREWDTAWPNQYRADSLPDMLAYTSLQDVDMALLFTYVTGPTSDKLEDFAIQSDPTVWGLFGAGARIFLGEMIDPARYTADLLYTDYDLQHWGPYLSQLHRLSWSCLVRNVADGAVPPPSRGISILCGRGGYGSAPPRNWVMFQRVDAVPPGDRVAAVENLVKANHVPLTLSPITTQEFHFSGLVYDADQTALTQTEVGFLAKDLDGKPWTPVGLDALGQFAFGAYDPSRHALVLPLVTSEEGLRASLDLLHIVGADLSHEEVDSDDWRSDTGQITRETSTGQLLVNAPGCAIVAGEFKTSAWNKSGSLRFETPSPDGAVVLNALDARPLWSSRTWDLKMVTRAENTGQALSPAPAGTPAAFELEAEGHPPIVTDGSPSSEPTRVFYGRSLLAAVFMTGGTWELVREPGRLVFSCDTAGVRFHIPGSGPLVALFPGGSRRLLHRDDSGDAVYPRGAAAVVAH